MSQPQKPLDARLLLGWRKAERPLGRLVDVRIDPELEPIWQSGEGHLITVAPTGAGKGVSCILPALMAWDAPGDGAAPPNPHSCSLTKPRSSES